MSCTQEIQTQLCVGAAEGLSGGEERQSGEGGGSAGGVMKGGGGAQQGGTRAETHPEVSSSWEVLAVLVEGDGHDPVGGVESLLHAVTVVNVDVDVQHPLVVPWERNKR